MNRLQQNWKVKRQRQAAIVPGNEGFTFDLFDNSYDQAAIIRSLSMSTVRVNHDAAGMLAINVSPDLCHSLQLGFVGVQTDDTRRKSNENKSQFSGEHNLGETGEESLSDEECVKKTNSLLREVHEAIFNEQVILSFHYCCCWFACLVCPIFLLEHLLLVVCCFGFLCFQVFDLVNREAFNTVAGVSVTGIRENYLQLSLGQGTSVYLILVSNSQDHSTVEGELTDNAENAILPLESSDGMKREAKQNTSNKGQFSNSICYEIYIQQIFHEYIFGKGGDKPSSSGNRLSGIQAKDGSSLLGHFFKSLAHRIFSTKVLAELENVV